MKKIILLSIMLLLTLSIKAQLKSIWVKAPSIFPLTSIYGGYDDDDYVLNGQINDDFSVEIVLEKKLGNSVMKFPKPAMGLFGLEEDFMAFSVNTSTYLFIYNGKSTYDKVLLTTGVYIVSMHLEDDVAIINDIYRTTLEAYNAEERRVLLAISEEVRAIMEKSDDEQTSEQSAFKQHKAEVEAQQSNSSSEKYISVGFLKHFKGFYPKKVNTNTIVYPNGDKVGRRSGLLFIGENGNNFLITMATPNGQIYALPTFKSHPDLGNIISLQVFFLTEVAVITAKNSKVIDYEVIGKLEPGTYAVPLDDKGCNTGFFSVALPENQLDYWYFQREDCTLSIDLMTESFTWFDYK